MRILQFGNKPKIEAWFPKPIFIYDDFADKHHSSINEWLLEFFAVNGEFKRTAELNVNTTHEVHDISQDEIFSGFIADLSVQVKQFASAIGYSNLADRIHLQNMWSNISRNGEYLFPHNHPSSLISGAYYVECSSDRDIIKFYDNPQAMLPPPTPNNQFGFEDVSYQCKPKRLLLFKSDMMHGCPALVGDRKIVISFNFGI